MCGVTAPGVSTRRRRRVKNLRAEDEPPIAIRAHYHGIGEIVSTLDSGAVRSVVRAMFVRHLPDVGGGCNRWWRLGNGQVVREVKRVHLDLTIHGTTYTIPEVIVFDDCPHAVLLGRDWMRIANAMHGYQDDRPRVELNRIPISTVSQEWWRLGGPPALAAVCRKATTVNRRCVSLVSTEVLQRDGTIVVSGRCAGDGWHIPTCVLTVNNHEAKIPIFNFSDQRVSFQNGDILAAVAERVVLNNKRALAMLGRPGDREPYTWERRTEMQFNTEDVQINSDLPAEDRIRLASLLTQYADCFAGEGAVGVTTKAVHRIDTGTARPLRTPPYQSSFRERSEIAQLTKEMMDEGVVKPSCSPWSSGVVLVRKKNGEARFCFDYRRLNAITKKDVYPLPRIDDSLNRLAGAKYFSSLDLKSGYCQVSVAKEDQEKTAFATPDGLFEFTKMPFGLVNAPATFQRLMDDVLAVQKWRDCLGPNSEHKFLHLKYQERPSFYLRWACQAQERF